VSDSECSFSRLAKTQKAEFTYVNEHFCGERKEENGHYGQTLIKLFKTKHTTMKTNKSVKIRLGIFVSLGLVLFIIGIYFIGKKQQLFSNTFRISGVFKDISGLQVGNNVRFSGINVGVIENIEIIADTAVRVDIVINENARKFIKKDSKAIIGSDGLMGNKILTILPGTNGKKVIQNDDFIATTVPVSIDDILLNLQIASSNAAYITDDLSAITNNIRSGKGTIGKLFMDTVFAGNLDKTIINIKQGAGGFKQNMDAASHNFLLRGFFKKKTDTKKKEETKK
jgi:phospholipid/cholesterol/gamma-HCH transport system substrate-binding protein